MVSVVVVNWVMVAEAVSVCVVSSVRVLVASVVVVDPDVIVSVSVMVLPAVRNDNIMLERKDGLSYVVYEVIVEVLVTTGMWSCLLYTSPSPRDGLLSRMPSSA